MAQEVDEVLLYQEGVEAGWVGGGMALGGGEERGVVELVSNLVKSWLGYSLGGTRRGMRGGGRLIELVPSLVIVTGWVQGRWKEVRH